MFASPQPVYRVADIRRIEDRVIPGAEPPLMERAGRAAAEDAIRLIMDRNGPILIACGPGNNGGDGFVMARHLLRAGRQVTVAFAGNPDSLPDDAARALKAYLDEGGAPVADLPSAPSEGWALVVDALFGIGLARAVEGRLVDWIAQLNSQSVPRMAIDVPSGLNADTGCRMGTVFRATHTTTFIALKPGLLTLDGPDACGDISVRDLGIDPAEWVAPSGQFIRRSLFRAHLTQRPRNTHKGLYGATGILGGAAGMGGAALLAGRAALWMGAGKVFVGMLDPNAPAIDTAHPELMLRAANELPDNLTTLAAGPGLGTAESARQLLHLALKRDIPLVLDADALNLLGRHGNLNDLLKSRSAPTILTPHPAEAARMLQADTQLVQTDRLRAALTLAQDFHSVVVLKGCGSIIATPEGQWYVNGTGHPGMATAGMGDVLTGLIAGLLSQHWPAEAATVAAVHLHGAAAERLSQQGVGPIGLSAGETIAPARSLFNEWLNESATAAETEIR